MNPNKYEGDIALDDTSLLTRTLVSGVLKRDLAERVNLINALVLLNEQGVSYNIEKCKHRGFSNYIELTFSHQRQTNQDWCYCIKRLW